jgi:hypothetical protein
VVAGYEWISLMGMHGQVEEQRREAASANQQYERITATFPVTQTTTDNLKATVVEFTSIATQSASPEPALTYLSQILENFPQIEIESVQWKVGRPDERTEGGPNSSKPSAAPVPGDAKSIPSGETLQLLEVTGRVNAIKRSEYRAITGQVQRFAEALRTDPAWRIVRTQLPFDVTSEGTLSGDIGSAEGSDAPKFTITVGRALK